MSKGKGGGEGADRGGVEGRGSGGIRGISVMRLEHSPRL